MDQLSHRERVLLALDHQDTDRVPMDLCGSTCNMVDALYFKVRDMLGIVGDIPPYRSGRTSSYYDERILDAFDTDFRHISIKSAKSHPTVIAPDGTYIDEWGVKLRLYAGEVQCLESPLENAEDADEVFAHTQWPDTTDRSRVEGLKERVQYLRKHRTSRSANSSPRWAFGARRIPPRFPDCPATVDDEDMANASATNNAVKIDLYNMMLEEIDGDVDIVELSEAFGTQGGCSFRRSLPQISEPALSKIIAAIASAHPRQRSFSTPAARCSL